MIKKLFLAILVFEITFSGCYISFAAKHRELDKIPPFALYKNLHEIIFNF